MTRTEQRMRMTREEWEAHPYKYVTQTGEPTLLTMDDETGATLLAVVEFEEDVVDTYTEAYAVA